MTDGPPSVQITTGARLHFGLIDVAAPFGGCGVMIDQPATIVRASPAKRFVCSRTHTPDRLHRRITAIADRLARATGLRDKPPVEIQVLAAAPAHQGVGSGTQFQLAVAESMGLAMGWPGTSADWIEIANRGHRSAVGAHGYFRGGFIVEGCSAVGVGESEHQLGRGNAIDHRLEFPPAWAVAVLSPQPGERMNIVSGEFEQSHFDALPPVGRAQRQRLIDMILGDMVESIRDDRFADFAEIVHQYNAASGHLFATVQGGAYHGDDVAACVDRLRSSGFAGVGQSSWGPGVFVWLCDIEHATMIPAALRDLARDWTMMVARPLHQSRRLEYLA